MNIIATLAIIGLFFILGLSSPIFCAEPQQENLDEISITTYYPSPYGVYNEMRANKMVVDADSSATVAPSFSGGLSFRGLTADPASPDTWAEGTMYYNKSSDVIKYSPDGSSWKEVGGGQFFEAWGDNVQLQLGLGGTAWVVWDISAWVPASAKTAVILCSTYCGVRELGSIVERCLPVPQGYLTWIASIKNRQVEVYTYPARPGYPDEGGTPGSYYRVIGYWE